MPLCIPPPFHIKEHQNSSLCSATDVYDLIFFFFTISGCPEQECPLTMCFMFFLCYVRSVTTCMVIN